MNLKALVYQGGRIIRNNSPTILAAVGVSGVVTTAYLAANAGYQHAFDNVNSEEWNIGEPKKEEFKRVWKRYIPVTVTGVITIGCIVASTKSSQRRTATMAAAYTLTERAFSEYREKVVEKIGERKEQGIRDELAQEKIAATAPPREVVLVGAGSVLCCELHTGRYFLSDMETLKKARNDVNFRALNHDYATLSDFYHLIGLSPTAASSDFGWTSDKIMELEISTTMAEDNRPCLAFDYNYVKAL